MTKIELKFKATIDIIDVNPFIFVPEKILAKLFEQARRDKGPIPICGKINGKEYKQTLMKFRGAWRLYINTIMLKDSPKRVGEVVTISVAYDPVDRSIKPHPKFVRALKENPKARSVLDSLPKSRKHEIIRYISSLKTDESIDRNIRRAIDFLHGKGRFVGRDKP